MDKTFKTSSWIIGILITVIVIMLLIIVFVVSFRLSDNKDVINIVSLASGMVSIILGSIAIIFSLYQWGTSSQQGNEMQRGIDILKEKLGTLNDAWTSIKLSANDDFQEMKININKLNEIVNDKIQNPDDIKEIKEKQDIIDLQVKSIEEKASLKDEFIDITNEIVCEATPVTKTLAVGWDNYCKHGYRLNNNFKPSTKEYLMLIKKTINDNMEKIKNNR